MGSNQFLVQNGYKSYATQTWFGAQLGIQPMFQYRFSEGNLTAEHRRSDAVDLLLQVERVSEKIPGGTSHELQITGELSIPCIAGENRFRLGQQPELRLRSPTGQFARMRIVLTQLINILPSEPGRRLYRWAFLVPLGADSDQTGFFPRTPKQAFVPPSAAPEQASSSDYQLPNKVSPGAYIQARKAMVVNEVSLSELLQQLSAEQSPIPVNFTAEGGFSPLE